MKTVIAAMMVLLVFGETVPFLDTHALVTDMACIKQTYKKIIFRAYQSIGKIDPYVTKNLDSAKAAGLPAEVYLNPCYMCKNPEAQATEIMTALSKYTISMMWISVHGYWSPKTDENIAFLKAFANALKAKGAKVGIFTFEPTWVRLMGKSCSDFSELPLWYMRWNKDPEKKDFTPFGGWKNPVAKQYKANSKVCGISADLDSYYN